MPSVVVTGASRGIGRAIAIRLADLGWDVVAGIRRAEDGESLRAERSAVRPVTLDVSDQDNVDALRGLVGSRVDALVNNAGIVVSGPLETTPIEDLRRQLDVNVVGQVAVTQALLPALRAARGRIVFMSSISGRVASPFMGYYSASKFGLEGLADSLRIELRPWKIPVVLVEPGAIDTDLWRGSTDSIDQVESSMSKEHRALYGAQIAASRPAIARVAKSAAPVDTVVSVVEKALTARRPRPRYLVGTDAKAQRALGAALPTRAFDTVVSRMLGGT
jgi:NAD(P)-dependent dehydrogenase (short-subunit alcohol dehydrogenase family)